MMYESQQAQASMTLHQPQPVRKGLRRNASLYHAVIQREGPNQFTVDTLRHLHEAQALHHSTVTAKPSQVAFPAQLAAPKPTDGDRATKIRRSQSVRAVLKKSASFLLGKTRSSRQTAPVQPNLEATPSHYLPVALTDPRGATLVSPLSSSAATEPKVWSNSLHRAVSKKTSSQTSHGKRWKSLMSLGYQPSAPTLQGPIYETIDDAYCSDQMGTTNRPVGVYKSQSHVSLMPVPLPTAPSSSSSAVSSPRAIGYMGATSGGSWSVVRPRNPLVDLSPAEEDEDTSSSSPAPSVVIPASRFLQGTVDDGNDDVSHEEFIFYPHGYQSLPLHPFCAHQAQHPPVYLHDWKPPTPPPMIHCGCRRCHFMARKNMHEEHMQPDYRHPPHLRRHVSFQLKETSPAVTTAAAGSTAVGAKSNANVNKKESTGQTYLLPRNGQAAVLNAKSPGPNPPRRSLSKPGQGDRREVEPISAGNSGDSSGSSPSGVGSNSSTSSSSGTGSAPRTPMTSAEALSLYGSRLTAYERLELEHYPEVWYLGLEARKIHGEPGGPQNGGYDDENGSYHKVLHDHLAFRYEILEVIGKGSFGQVIRALDHKSGQQVAIKIIRNKKRFHHQALVEIRILDHLRRRDKDGSNHVIHMLDYFYFRSHLCITFELLSLNLYEVLKKQGYQGFNLGLIRRLGRSLLECLRLLKQENIIHCDLKPENVLVQARGSASIKVIDFGSSCYSHQRVYTYIQSRFYRSPEVILGLPYGPPIDMWSFGCILCEMYTGYPLFPGENEMEQLACIMECLGLPSENVVANATRRRLFFDSRGQPRCITNTKGRKRRPGSKDLASILKCNDAAFVNLVSRCLEWDPAKRLTPEEALRHEWFISSMQSSPNTPSVSSPRLSDQDASQASKEKDRERDKDKLKNFQMYQVYKAKKTTGSNKAAGSLFPDDQSIPEPPNLDDSGTFLPTIL